jgi:subtilase family serine protease
VTAWPATDPLVTAAGGTQLVNRPAGRFSPVVWDDTGNTAVNEEFEGAAGRPAVAPTVPGPR